MSESPQIILFENPRAGSGAGGLRIAQLAELLAADGYKVRRTAVIQELRELVTTQGRRIHAIVSAGGDGTAETVANVTSDAGQADIPIAVLPLGTENLLAKYLGIETEPQHLAELIRIGHQVTLDAGAANGKVFLLMLSCGFDADVVRRMHEERQGNISHLAYAMPMIDSIRKYDYPNLRVIWEKDGTTQQRDCHWVFCFNAPAYAAGLKIIPDADPTDGLLDVGTFGGGSFWHGLWQFSAVVLGQHQQMPDFHHVTSPKLRIESDHADVPYQIDGDPGGMLPVDVEVLPRHLRVIADPTKLQKAAP